MRSAGSSARPVWGHLLLLCAFAGFVVWYVLDARRASPFVENTILIVPAGGLALLLILSILPQIFRSSGRHADGERNGTGVRFLQRHGQDLRALRLMALLGLYIALMPVAGFDIATFLFLATGFWAVGERRVWVTLGLSALLAFILVAGMKAVLSLDLPTTIL